MRRYGKHYLNRDNFKHTKNKEGYNFKNTPKEICSINIPPNADITNVTKLMKQYEDILSKKLPNGKFDIVLNSNKIDLIPKDKLSYTEDTTAILNAMQDIKIVPYNENIEWNINGIKTHQMGKRGYDLVLETPIKEIYGSSLLPLYAAPQVTIPKLCSKLEIGTKNTYY